MLIVRLLFVFVYFIYFFFSFLILPFSKLHLRVFLLGLNADLIIELNHMLIFRCNHLFIIIWVCSNNWKAVFKSNVFDRVDQISAGNTFLFVQISHPNAIGRRQSLVSTCSKSGVFICPYLSDILPPFIHNLVQVATRLKKLSLLTEVLRKVYKSVWYWY